MCVVGVFESFQGVVVALIVCYFKYFFVGLSLCISVLYVGCCCWLLKKMCVNVC